MSKRDELIEKLLEEVAPLREKIQQNIQKAKEGLREEEEEENERGDEATRRRLNRFHTVSSEIINEANSILHRLIPNPINNAGTLDREYPATNPRPHCTLQLRPTLDFPLESEIHVFCTRDPLSPAAGKVTVSLLSEYHSQEILACDFLLEGEPQPTIDEAQERTAEGIVRAVKAYLEMRAKGTPK